MRGGSLNRLTIGSTLATRRAACDVYHTSYWLPLLAPKNSTVTIHDLLPETHPEYFSPGFRLAATTWFRHSARHAEHVFTVSEYSRQTLLERYGMSPDRVSITPCAVDRLHFSPDRSGEQPTCKILGSGKRYFLVVGRLDPRKQPGVAVEAFRKLPPSVSGEHLLVFAGSGGTAEEPLRRTIERHGLESRVLILKDVLYDALPDLYRSAVATISCSAAEGFGLPLLEAMSCASPVIGPMNSAQTEVIQDAGLLYETGDAEALSEAMNLLAQNSARRDSLKRASTERANAFSWDIAAKVFVDRCRSFSLA